MTCIDAFVLSEIKFLVVSAHRPGDLDRTGKSMLFLQPDAGMRRLAAACFIVRNGEIRLVCAKCFEQELSLFTAPDLDDVLMHVFVFKLAGTDRDRLPVEDNI